MQVEISLSFLLYTLISVVLPIVVAFVTKQEALGKFKAYVLLTLSALTGLLTEAFTALEAGNEFDWKIATVGALYSLVVASATHAGYLKPLGITGSDGIVQKKVTGGLG